ncbi:MAG TPA: UDP-N-acetylmuramoyl-L-alanyl-D-glutamate--2,6-diaminopimelate ligase [Anaerolineae bacterium]|nr:UDP-N-acetylmuramoyl-L-alanyl-D-glutamate--2,6-diaminopimelate ligase [Anaerolineae bacterium]
MDKNIKTLSALISSTPNFGISGSSLPNTPITDIAFDSRKVGSGNIFVALKGGFFNGHDFIRDAVSKGAEAVVGTEDLDDLPVPYLRVNDSREVLAYLSAAYYGFPARQLTMVGVTGTDGKTTTVNLIYQIMLAAGLNAGMISTVNAVIGNETIDTGFHVTTPESPIIQKLLARMLDQGATHVVLEATSHGLHQYRVNACEFDVGVITNITHEHLDYHGSYDHYLNSKAQLLKMLGTTVSKPNGNPRLAIINHDDISYPRLAKMLSSAALASVQVVAYSIKEKADIYAKNIKMTAGGLEFGVMDSGDRMTVKSNLIGEYNAANILAALAAAVKGLDISLKTAVKGAAALRYVPGRMEKIDMGQGFTAFVDFAHTPNALKVTLETARGLTNGRVIAVFGSAGLRDREKRRLMAEISIELADITILTAEDPRTESLEEILSEMAHAAEKRGGLEGKNLFQIADRGSAISKAVNMAEPADLVIVCGKGHEQSMCFGEIEYPWDDRTAMRAALSELLGVEGAAMPYLPTQNKESGQ